MSHPRQPVGSHAVSGAFWGRFGGEDSGCFDGSMVCWTPTPSTRALRSPFPTQTHPRSAAYTDRLPSAVGKPRVPVMAVSPFFRVTAACASWISPKKTPHFPLLTLAFFALRRFQAILTLTSSQNNPNVRTISPNMLSGGNFRHEMKSEIANRMSNDGCSKSSHNGLIAMVLSQ